MKKLLLPFTLAVIALLSGCQSLQIDRTHTAVSQDSRVQYLVIHYTAEDFPSSFKTLTEGKVSAHYLVNDNPPVIYQLVDENRRAYQAGVSSWQGQTQLNAASIGIEIVNKGFRKGANGERVWFDYPQAQIDQVIAMVKDIVKRHDIRPDRIVGHSDIAPQRKQDPGPRFPWKQLADAGIIPWPDAAEIKAKTPGYEMELPDIEWFQRKLARFGYAVPINGQLDEATVNVLAALQMKYRPAKIDGFPDAETAALLDVLTAN
ncbi:MAG: N-acetylmuramoyl-L-alanine amidase [Betaproteobacteria bacterium]|nr:N-acetylmuramoyl-L-alanine amidase [Betaproteobacteria bacterium]